MFVIKFKARGPALRALLTRARGMKIPPRLLSRGQGLLVWLRGFGCRCLTRG